MCNICKNGCFVGVCECKCHQEGQAKDSWRENIQRILAKLLYENEVGLIPTAVVIAIDAAYVAGMDNLAEEIKKAEINAVQVAFDVHKPIGPLLAKARKEGAMEVIDYICKDNKWNNRFKQQLKAKFGGEVG